jgi:hypothetical protein
MTRRRLGVFGWRSEPPTTCLFFYMTELGAGGVEVLESQVFSLPAKTISALIAHLTDPADYTFYNLDR